MIDSKQVEQAVCAYMNKHFEGVSLSDKKRLALGGGTAYFFKTSEDEYELRILDELTDKVESSDEINTFLEDFDAANVLRELVGFPVTVSLNGCVFEDF